jgi:intracellular septation protein
MAKPEKKTMNPFLRLALDLGPLIVLFAVYYSMSDFFVATGAFMVALTIAIGVGVAIERKISPMPLFTLGLVLLFGGLTLWLEEEYFFKIKPTVLYVMFAALLWCGLLVDRIFLKYLLAQSIEMPDPAWRTLTRRWALFFLGLAVLNEIVWRNFSTDVWVAFKVWGILPLTLLFVVSQTPFIARHQRDESLDATSK